MVYLTAFLVLTGALVVGYILISVAGAVSQQMYLANKSLTAVPGNPTNLGVDMNNVIYSAGSTIYWALITILAVTIIAVIISLAFSPRR